MVIVLIVIVAIIVIAASTTSPSATRSSPRATGSTSRGAGSTCSSNGATTWCRTWSRRSRATPTHERQTFEKVTQARADAMSAQSVADTAQAEQGLTGALAELRAVAENYPTLRATENFQQLSRNLSELEDEIQASRRIYNSNVQSYNTTIQQFPGSIIANQGGFTAREFFEIEDSRARAGRGQLRAK